MSLIGIIIAAHFCGFCLKLDRHDDHGKSHIAGSRFSEKE